MLTEIAAANAIFKTLSTAFKNGKQLYEVGGQVSDYLSATQKVKEKAGDASSRGTALECFQYAEQQRVQREQLEHFLKKSRLNGWSDFVKFEAEWHRERKEEEKEQARQRFLRQQKFTENLTIATKVFSIIAIVMIALFVAALLLWR